MSVARRFAALAIVALLARPAKAQSVLDQQQQTAVPFFSNTQFWTAQTFKTSASNVSGAGFYLTNFSGSAQVHTIDLWSGNPSGGGTKLASGTVSVPYSGPVPASGYPGYWYDVFWAPVSVTTGQTYWLTIGSTGTQTVTWLGAGIDPYADGMAWYNYSSVETSSYTDFADYDLTFRTYTDENSVVPEPSSWTLIAAGIVGVFGVSRRRRRGT
ncbi:MAG: PEP-CTERM sorting domain-containing protein [Gemmatimonadetes bacterium]|nr:PEP-CTERM sorting domain-containing protein [Gemmatimonadota bacterium]